MAATTLRVRRIADRFLDKLFPRRDSTILVIRHGKTSANDNRDYYGEVPDPDVSLNEMGERQVRVLGEVIERYCKKNNIRSIGFGQSSYRRAEQTRLGITDRIKSFIKCVLRFDPELREKTYGVLDGLPAERQKQLSDLSDEHYKKMPFYAARPGGESDANVVARVRTYLSEVFYPFAANYDLGIIITHSTTMRAIIVARLNGEIEISADNEAKISKQWEKWFDENKPENCEVWEIKYKPQDKSVIASVIFPGFDKDGKIAQCKDRFSEIMSIYTVPGDLPRPKPSKDTTYFRLA